MSLDEAAQFADDVLLAMFRIQMVLVADLQVHPGYQRSLDKTRATRYAKNWQWIGYRPIVIARVNGVLWIIDGQHRAKAAELRGIERLPAFVIER